MIGGRLWRVVLISGWSAAVLAGKQTRLGAAEGVVERMGLGIAALGRGNTGSADPQTSPGAYWNPAFLALRWRTLDFSAGGERRSLDRYGYALGIEGGVGQRAGVGAAIGVRMDGNFPVINEDDVLLGHAMPSLGSAWVGVGWRLSRMDAVGFSMAISWMDLDVARYYSDIDMVDEQQGNSSMTLGYYRALSNRWNLGVVVRNVGFNRDLSARWEYSPSRDNSLPSSTAWRPKVLQVGLRFADTLAQMPLAVYLEALDYQLADTLLVFDPDWHVWLARMGLEWKPFARGAVRVGYDAGHWSCGASYEFRIRSEGKVWPLQLDWALIWETTANQWSPLSVGVRSRL